MKLKTIQELDFAAQRTIVGGEATTGCTCQSCACDNDTNNSSRSEATTKVTEGVSIK